MLKYVFLLFHFFSSYTSTSSSSSFSNFSQFFNSIYIQKKNKNNVKKRRVEPATIISITHHTQHNTNTSAHPQSVSVSFRYQCTEPAHHHHHPAAAQQLYEAKNHCNIRKSSHIKSVSWYSGELNELKVGCKTDEWMDYDVCFGCIPKNTDIWQGNLIRDN